MYRRVRVVFGGGLQQDSFHMEIRAGGLRRARAERSGVRKEGGSGCWRWRQYDYDLIIVRGGQAARIFDACARAPLSVPRRCRAPPTSSLPTSLPHAPFPMKSSATPFVHPPPPSAALLKDSMAQNEQMSPVLRQTEQTQQVSGIDMRVLGNVRSLLYAHSCCLTRRRRAPIHAW